MKARNRLFAILLALAMMITYMPGLAYALEEQPAVSPAAGETLDGEEGAVETPQEDGQEAPAAEQAGGAEETDGEAVEAGNDETPAAPEAAPEATQDGQDPAEGEEPAAEEPDSNEEGGSSAMTATVKAERKGESKIIIPKTKLAGGDELLMTFLEKKARGDLDKAEETKGRKSADTPDDLLYDVLKVFIKSIAYGKETRPQLSVSPSELTESQFTYSADDLNLESIFIRDDQGELVLDEDDNVQISDAAFEAAVEAYTNDFSYSAGTVVGNLLKDLPFEFFWYDKTTGFLEQSRFDISASINGDEETITLDPEITFSFSVAETYRSDADPEEIENGDEIFNLYYTDDDLIYDANEAAENAAEIVDDAEDESDYDKLIIYKDAICDRTSYNDEAAGDDYEGGYGDPWQLIYVFDEDDETNVVCEGYSKAFQFLCDLTDSFEENNIDCASVTGTMAGGTGAGPHMWNVVTMDGNNYLADITNCDSGTIGDPDQLFLVGWSEEIKDDSDKVIGYSYTCKNEGSTSNVDYIFDGDMFMEMSGAPYVDLEECEIVFDNAEIYNEQIPFFTVDLSGENKDPDIEDLGISIRDRRGRIADAGGYDLSFSYYAYGETPEEDELIQTEGPFGIKEVDAEYGMTEYHVTATANGKGTCKGKTGEFMFYVRDKNSLQWFGAVVNFENGLKDSWRMRDRFWIQSGHMSAPTVQTVDGTDLDTTDYTITYYRAEGDPSEDSQNKSWEDYIVADDAHKLA